MTTVRSGPKAFLAVAAVAVLWASIFAGSAQAFRPLLSEAFLKTTFCKHCGAPPSGNPVPPSEGQLEDPCGLAIGPGGEIYVADYYHRAVDVFSASGEYAFQIALPGGPISGFGINERDGVCGLAVDSSGALYADEWHQGVVQLRPSEFTLDRGESTGVAVDAAGDVFANDRTYVAEYAAPVHAGEEPTTLIGQRTLGDAYGVAVSPSGGRVYVADAASGTVKVFERTGEQWTAVASLAPPGGFISLVDSALTIDATVEPGLPEHLLVLDNLEPGYEHPEAAVEEFEAPGSDHPGSYAYVGRVRGPAGALIVDGEPSGLAVDAAGNLLVTDGIGELGNAFEFGPDPPGAPTEPASAEALTPDRTIELAPGTAEVPAAPASVAGAGVAPHVFSSHRRRHRRRRLSHRHFAISPREVIQRGGTRVSVEAAISPRRLPRTGAAPIHFSLATKIAATEGSVPPQLRGISIEINRYGHFDPAALPSCTYADVQPSTNEGALAACRDSLVGEGSFAAKVLISSQAPFPSVGKVLAFNGRWHGRPAILAHIYGTKPVPTSYTLPFVIGRTSRGSWGTTLSASLPGFTSQWGYVTGIAIYLGHVKGSHSFLTASCPAPKGFPAATFPLARASLSFTERAPISETLTRSCRTR